MTEGELTDRYLVKAVFYSLYFGADRVRLDASDYQRFAECFVNCEERTRTIENPDGRRVKKPMWWQWRSRIR